MESFLARIIKAGIILILFAPLVVGFFGLNVSEYPKTVFFRSIVEVIFIFYIFLVLTNRNYVPKKSVLLVSVAAFYLVLIATSAIGINFYQSFFGELYRAEGIILHLHLFVFFIILISVFSKKEEWQNLFRISAAVGFFSSMVLIFHKLGIPLFYDLDFDMGGGTMSNKNFFGNYIVLIIFITILLFFSERKKYLKAMWLCSAVFNGYALFLSGTRGAFVGIFAGLLFCFFISFFNLNRKKRITALVGFLVFCILVLLVFLNQGMFEKMLKSGTYLERLFSITKFDIGERGDLWLLSIDAFKEKPLTGWGFESFSFVFDKYIGQKYPKVIIENTYFDRPHNKVLEILLYGGAVGFASYILIFMSIFWMIFRRNGVKDGWNDKPKIFFSSILAGFFISYFFQNIFSFDTAITYILFFLMAAFINNNFAQTPILKEYPRPFKKSISPLNAVFASFTGICMILVLYWVNLKPTIAAMNFPDSIKYELTNPERAFRGYQKGISMNTIYDEDLRMAFTDRVIFLLENGLGKNIEKDMINALLETKPFLYKDLEENYYRTNNIYNYLARINEQSYIVLGKDKKYLDEMENVLDNAMAFNNAVPVFSQLFGELKIARGEYEEGEKYIENSCRLSPKGCSNKLELYKRMGIAYFKVGDKKDAVKNFQVMLDLDYERKKQGRGSNSEEMAQFIDAVAIMYSRYLNDMENCRITYEKGAEIYPEYREFFKQRLEILIAENKS